MNFPDELLGYRQWVLWRRAEVNGKSTKVPVSPWSGKPASCDNPKTWSTYKHAFTRMRRYACQGVGFVFTATDPFCGVDIDNCRDAHGELTSQATEILIRLKSYSEVSPSGTGIHVLIKAKLSKRGRRRNGVEFYDAARYFTIIGRHVRGTPLMIHERQAEAAALEEELFHEVAPHTSASRHFRDISERELIERARVARNGDRFWKLWSGDCSDYDNDHSRADAALCSILAFWTNGDAALIDRLFRQSGLMRDKWDRRTGQETYGSLTIKGVVRLV